MNRQMRSANCAHGGKLPEIGSEPEVFAWFAIAPLDGSPIVRATLM
ncbi:MAG: hypothetical protein PHO55_10710 [Thiomonas arsenitoxydans]|jgi:hypothetical protein|nr:hypothetical protein [Thiomonas arsenitoxydans]